MIKELIKIGLTEKQARVYSALLAAGEVTIGPLQKELGMHKQIIYNILDSLIKTELVLVIKRNGRKYFKVNDPEILLQRNKTQGQLIENLIPKIHAQAGINRKINEINIYQGVEAWHAFHKKILKALPRGANADVIGAGGKMFLEIMQQRCFFDRYENLRTYKKISHKLLLYENQRENDAEFKIFCNRKYVQIKFLPEVFRQPITTSVWPDRVSILLLGDEPQIVEIKSQKIRDGFKNYFDVLWGMGKE